MKYKDLTAKSLNLNFFSVIVIGASKIWGELVCFFALLKIVRKNKFFFIHIHSINYLISCFIVKMIFKIPIGLNLGGTDFERAKNIWFYRLLLKRVDRIFFVSYEMKDELLKITKKSIIHTSNGFNSEIFYNTNVNREDYLISVGNLRWQKNHRMLIKSFAKVIDEFPNFKLLTIGSGPEKDSLINLVSELNLQSHILFYGQMNQSEIARIMNQSKVFCLPSISEGFPKVILEAFSCGLPVVSTDVGDCRNIIEDAGLIAGSNADKFSKAIIQILKDDNYINLGKRGEMISKNIVGTMLLI